LSGVDTQQLADGFDGQDLAVGQDWPRAALAQPLWLACQPVID
jgi:hypothetical protein